MTEQFTPAQLDYELDRLARLGISIRRVEGKNPIYNVQDTVERSRLGESADDIESAVAIGRRFIATRPGPTRTGDCLFPAVHKL